MQRRQIFMAAGASLLGGLSSAQTPSQSAELRIVVPFGPGGATDIVARIVAGPLAKALGQTVYVDNRPGEGGSLGMAEVARADDGRTLGLASVSTHGVNPAIYKHLPYDAQADFRPVCALVSTPTVMVVHPSLPTAHAAFYKQAKDPGNAMKFASPGIGSLGHMLGELYKSTTGTRLVNQPFGGTAQARDEVIAGRAHVMFDNLPSSAAAIADGRVKAIAVSSAVRLDALPGVPTFAELSLFSNNDPSWFGLVAPQRMRATDADRIGKAMLSVLARTDVAAQLRAQGMTPLGSPPEDFARLIAKEISKMRRVARFARISMA
jgi:tripartite-type tricarboxylate transporter receptor subunit TctC